VTKSKKRVKRRTKYSESLKRKISKEYLAGKASYAILAEEHNLANKGVVREFVKWYKRVVEQESINENQVKDSGENQVSKSGDLQSNPEVERLRKELELSRLKVEMLETIEKSLVPISSINEGIL